MIESGLKYQTKMVQVRLNLLVKKLYFLVPLTNIDNSDNVTILDYDGKDTIN